MESDTILIQALIDSYRLQLGYYNGLRDLVRQLMGKLILSRGVLSHCADGFTKKKVFLESIEHERDKIADVVVQWQLRKQSVQEGHETRELNSLLQQVATAIQEFLHDEDQLQKYIEGVVARSMAPK